MNRFIRLALLCCVLGIVAFAQEGEGGGNEGEGSNVTLWKWANFLVLAGGLGYLMGKHLPPLFASRSREIRKQIIEADDARKDAEARSAEVDRRLANLEAEIAALHAEARREEQSETERLARHTEAEMAKIRVHAEQEIAAAGKAARMDLKRHAAELAIELAKQKLQARVTPDIQDTLVRSFVRDLK